MANKIAVVLLSGGLDSTTCLYKAREEGFSPLALSFDYGQRHRLELNAAAKIAARLNIPHVVLAVDLRSIGGSALTDTIPVPKGGEHLKQKDQIPVTYVPARNLVFLSLAYALAEARSAAAIFIGANAIDYSGYPDCRPDFISAFTEAARLATKAGRSGQAPTIHTPLIALSKAEIAKEALRLGVPLADTWSCYDPELRGNMYWPCRNCDSCLLRAEGLAKLQAQISPEAIYGAPQALAQSGLPENPSR
ncbi:MAG: 7-cyano-7-deazaguanine synthase QueC [Turneriella sp.]|nr:7-cyano-7-deazaguanine synthase QueC [Turneriella sp.]